MLKKKLLRCFKKYTYMRKMSCSNYLGCYAHATQEAAAEVEP